MSREIDAFKKYIQKNIDELEKEKEGLIKQIEKVPRSLYSKDINKLVELTNKANETQHTINHFYMLIGGLNEDTLYY